MLAVRKTSRAFGRGKLHLPEARQPQDPRLPAASYGDDVILSRGQPRRARRSRWSSTSRPSRAACRSRCWAAPRSRRSASCPTCSRCPRTASTGSGSPTDVADAELAPGRRRRCEDRPVLVLFDGWTSLFRDRVMPWRIGMAERTAHAVRDRHAAALHRGAALVRRQGHDHRRARGWSTTRCGRPAAAAGCCRCSTLEGAARAAPTYFMPLALAWEDTRRRAHEARSRPPRRQGAAAGQRRRDGRRLRRRGLLPRRGARHRRRHASCRPRSGALRFRADARLGASSPATTSTTLPVEPPQRAEQQHRRHARRDAVPQGLPAAARGVNPELEIGRFLTEVARFPHCVPVAGALEYVGNDGTRDDARAAAGLRRRTRATAGTTRWPTWSASSSELRDTDGDLPRRRARRLPRADPTMLGRRTAELHLALRACAPATPAFDPEPLHAADLDALRERARAEARDARSTLLRDRIDAAARRGAGRRARAARARASALQARIDALPRCRGQRPQDALPRRLPPGPGAGGAQRLRHHRFRRRARAHASRSAAPSSSPLRDVAGMLRSFNYARWTALRRVAQNADELQRLDAAARDWEARDARRPSSPATPKTLRAAGRAAPVDAQPARAVRAGEGAVRAALRAEQPARLGAGSAAGHPGAARRHRPSR